MGAGAFLRFEDVAGNRQHVHGVRFDERSDLAELTRAQRDVLALLQQLADEGLVEVRDEAPA